MLTTFIASTVARFDFSSGSEDYHQATLENLKKAVKKTKKLCAVCPHSYMDL